jgi:hypothetical protein
MKKLITVLLELTVSVTSSALQSQSEACGASLWSRWVTFQKIMHSNNLDPSNRPRVCI